MVCPVIQSASAEQSKAAKIQRWTQILGYLTNLVQTNPSVVPMINEILAKHSGQSVEKIKEETERDRYMSAEEAKEYGLIDDVLHEEEKDKKKKK